MLCFYFFYAQYCQLLPFLRIYGESVRRLLFVKDFFVFETFFWKLTAKEKHPLQEIEIPYQKI